MDEGRNMILLFPTLIKFKSEQDRKNFEPRYALFYFACMCLCYRAPKLTLSISCHMFYTRRVLDIPDGKPKWSGLNGTSELMNEGPSRHEAEPDELSHKMDADGDTEDTEETNA
jgi:hypothetical protein